MAVSFGAPPSDCPMHAQEKKQASECPMTQGEVANPNEINPDNMVIIPRVKSEIAGLYSK